MDALTGRPPFRGIGVRRRLPALVACVVAALASVAARQEPPAAPTPRPRVLVVEVVGVIGPATTEHLEAALSRAERGRYDALLVRVDTPGGLLTSTRRIVAALLDAEVPVIAHVAPAGAGAGSAGVFVVMAAHVAAMAPGTNIGAAHPVSAFGRDVEQEGGRDLAEKVVNDAASLARAIAERRARNVEWADRAVRESVSATAREALELGVVDLVAEGEDEVLARADGRAISLPRGPVTLRTDGAARDDFPMTIRQRTLSVLGSPDLAYLLGMLGVLGLLLEFYSPGLIVPGAVGVLCLLLAAIGLDVLPVNAGALVLLAVAVGLLIAEAFVASYGLLTLAGATCLLIGSLLFIDTDDPDFLLDPSVRVSWTLVLPTVLVVVGALAGLLLYLRRTHRRPATTGSGGMLGARGRALTGIDGGGGRVVVHGETWSAVSTGPSIAPEAPVRVVGMDDLVLRVEPAPAAAPDTAGASHAP